jgi:hypothetical protein
MMLNHASQINASFLKQTPYWLLAGFWVCTAIAIAVVIRRLAVLAHPSTSGSSPMVALDRTFLSHTALTLAHIIPALGFVLVAPFALLRRFTAVRWPKNLLYPLGIVVGVTAYRSSFGNCNHASVYGCLFCDPPRHASQPPTILWNRILDWLLHQLDSCRRLASRRKPADKTLNTTSAPSDPGIMCALLIPADPLSRSFPAAR